MKKVNLITHSDRHGIHRIPRQVRSFEGDLVGQLCSLLCLHSLSSPDRCPSKTFKTTNNVSFHRHWITIYLYSQDAASGADGETIAGRRIRVSHARPRTVGPRDRFIPDRYARDRGELVSLFGLHFLFFLVHY